MDKIMAVVIPSNISSGKDFIQMFWVAPKSNITIDSYTLEYDDAWNNPVRLETNGTSYTSEYELICHLSIS
ncbi:hypothetical protein DPMN_031558 [Dreissena polymorpha]|uniref:Uncharacterized protein n=1 Tax=Dreissena polymorpha TaxID=45954 RepID=A0A9D4RH73_DREPO|nr:hypothetical protein DPMN_031558 [Dreissena polymorpha]